MKPHRKPPSTPLLPTLQTLLNLTIFRILVIGKTGSGKSSLADTIFGLDTAASDSRRKINRPEYEARFENNPRLVLHEYSVSERGDESQLYSYLESSVRPKLPLVEKIHVVWICVSSDDTGSVDCLKKIIDICRGKVAVVVVFTKFDELIFKIIMDISFDDLEDYGDFESRMERAKKMCRDQVEGMRQSLVRDSGVPTVYTSVSEDIPGTMEELAMQTEDAMREWLNARSRAALPILAWAVAQKYSKRIKVETSVYIGQWHFWSDLTDESFIGERVQILLDAIHTDLIDVWNLSDPSKVLCSDAFKTKMLHLVNEVVEVPSESSHTSTRSPSYSGRQTDRRPKWANEVYRARVTQISQAMAYIVSLSVILRKIFDKVVDVTEEHMEIPMDELVDDDIKSELREAVRTVPNSPNGSDGMVIFHELQRLVLKFCLQDEADE